MVTEVVMTVWIRLLQGSEKVKDLDVDKAHGIPRRGAAC